MLNFIHLKFKDFWRKTIFCVRSHLHSRLCKKSLKNKEGLKVARSSDQIGNYDIDGVSFDGNHIFVSGKFFNLLTYLTLLLARGFHCF
jgi:hypothetical protein